MLYFKLQVCTLFLSKVWIEKNAWKNLAAWLQIDFQVTFPRLSSPIHFTFIWPSREDNFRIVLVKKSIVCFNGTCYS